MMIQEIRTCAVSLLCVIILAACTTPARVLKTPLGDLPAVPILTKASGTITIERQQFIDTWAAVQVIYVAIMREYRVRCQAAPRIPQCVKVAGIDEQAKEVYLTVEAKIRNPEAEIDWDNVKELLGMLAKLVL